jgi:hypothetical protein
MKTILTTVLTFAAALQLLTTISASGATFFIDLQNDNGNTHVSVSWSGNITNTPYIDWVGIGGLFINSMSSGGGSSNYIYGLGSFVGYVDKLPGFGTFKDLTTGNSATMDMFVAIPNDAGSGSVIHVRFDKDLGNTTGDIIQYSPGVDSATIAVPFSSFNPGTYEVSPQQPIGMVLTVRSIPEPSTGLLTVLGALCLVLAGLRRTTVPQGGANGSLESPAADTTAWRQLQFQPPVLTPIPRRLIAQPR